MSWLGTVRDRAGPFYGEAIRWLADADQFPVGAVAPAIDEMALAHAVEDWCQRSDPAEAQDHRFVNGAGALFAMLLLRRFPEARHGMAGGVHGVRLGTCGWVHAFEPMEHALEADFPRVACLEAFELAAAEREGRGPHGRVFSEALTQLKRAHIAVHSHGCESILLNDGTELSLLKVIRATRGASMATVHRSVGSMLAPLTAGPSDLSTWEETKGQLFPRPVNLTFVQRQERAQLAHRPYLDDEGRVTWVQRFEDRVRFLCEPDLERWCITADQLHACAMENLAAATDRAHFICDELDHGPTIFARSRDGLDAARSLLPGFIPLLTKELGEKVCFAAPHRDGLFATGASGGGLAWARAQAQREFAAAPHRISPVVHQPIS